MRARQPRVLTTAFAAAAALPLICGLATSASKTASNNHRLTADVAVARQATAKYAIGLGRARADGYRIITRMIPDMGWHFMNAKVPAFDVRKPMILVYERRGGRWQLGALEWVFQRKPARAPLPGARYGSFPAACHYADGTFVPAAAQNACAPRAPKTGAKFTFWHPKLVTLHLWAWYPNPSGIFSSMHPMVHPFNNG